MQLRSPNSAIRDSLPGTGHGALGMDTVVENDDAEGRPNDSPDTSDLVTFPKRALALEIGRAYIIMRNITPARGVRSET